MELFRGNKDNSLSQIKEAILNKDVELEVIFGINEFKNPIQRNVFMRLLDACKTDYKFQEEVSQLDIRQEFKKNSISNIRCSIHGIDSIKQYCKTDSLNEIDNKEFIVKQKHKDKESRVFESIKDEDYNLRMTLKDELSLPLSDPKIFQFMNNHSESRKHFRYKKRFSFITQDQLFRIDLTVVKSTKKIRGVYNLKKRFREADILSQPEIYELEIEFIGHQKENRLDHYDRLFKMVEEQIQILKPGQRVSGNQFDPLNTFQSPFTAFSESPEISFAPSQIVEEQLEDISFDLESYGFESPRYNPHVDYTTSNQYSEMVGKQIRIKDNFWRQNPSISYLKIKMDEKYETMKQLLFHRPRTDGIVIDVKEIYGEDSKKVNAIVSLFPKLDDIETLEIPLDDIYDYTEEQSQTTQFPEWAPDGIIREDVKITLSREIILLLKEHIIHLSKIIYNTDTLFSQKLKDIVIDVYKRLTMQSKNSYFTLRGPQPISLEQKHLNKNTYQNILMNYAVTEKADGERYQMLITRKRGYLINSRQNIIDTGNVFNGFKGDWLFDGEYITKNKDNKPVRIFMIFDIYWNGNKTPQPIHTYPFFNHSLSNRYDISRHLELIAFQVELYSVRKLEGAIDIQVKEYEFGYLNKDKINPDDIDEDELMEIFESSKLKLLQDKEDYFPYRIDGLIFIPATLSVGASMEGSPVKNIGGEWKYNYKWKPPEENTIDFLVKTIKLSQNGKLIDQVTPYSDVYEDGRKEIKEYKRLGLYVGYDKQKDTTINYCMSILKGFQSNFTNDNAILFQPPDEKEMVHQTNIILDEGKMSCNNLEKEEIRDGDIVEMSYTPNNTKGILWEPLRVRRDKQKPQFFTTSFKIWETIMKPVSPEMIQGVVKKKLLTGKLSSEQGEYYVSNKKIFGGTEPLRKFHNLIKKKLIIGISSLIKSPKILDMSCGRGGDIQKYLHEHIKPELLVGIDISNNVSEACKRYYNEKTKVPGVFIRGDTSKNIRTSQCKDIPEISDFDSVHTETMLQILYGNDKNIPEKYKKISPNYKGMAKDGFDIISSQFSVHYYFKDEETFMGFIKNINENIASGGYFIGTCYDGEKVFNLEEPISEMKDEMGNLMYKIEKKYTIGNFTFNEDDTSNMLGNEIDVYMDSIGQTITEYLVNFKYFAYIMQQNGWKLVVPKGIKQPHSSIFKEELITDQLGDFEKIVKQLETFKDNSDPDYTSKMDPMIYDTELQLLTSLNKYFIFQKE
jgi:hypothetical protein